MKKGTLLALACAFFMGSSAYAQSEDASQEVTYVEDATQGYLFNRFKDNWFITAEGGANIYFSRYDKARSAWDRFAPAAGLYVGKWFSPIIGLRAGGHFMANKGLSSVETIDCRPNMINGYYNQKFNEFGIAADAMINLTNWWCGYHPGRVYNATLYAGGGFYWTYAHRYNELSNGTYEDLGWKKTNDRVAALRVGLINSFRVSEQVQLSLDIRYSLIDCHQDMPGFQNNKAHDLGAYIGVTYNFKKREWNAPVVPVCPPAENCDALRARLEAAEGRIADLEDQLKDCLNRPTEQVKEAPLATIYYPINVYKLTKKDQLILGAVAQTMKDNPQNHYILTGWADNYTGTDEVNTRIRHNRVNGVQKQLVKLGVPESQITATINAGNLCDLGEKYEALDRAVTIEQAK